MPSNKQSLPLGQKGVAHLLLLVLLVIGIGVGIYLVQNPAIFKPKADQTNKCLASDVESFKQCLYSAQTNESVNEIEITKQIICPSKEQCTSIGSGGGFILSERSRPLTIFGTPGTGAGFKRTQNYNYTLLTLGGVSVENVTLKNLIFDENRDSQCDFVTQGPDLCNTPLLIGPKIKNSTVDNITILHSKNHGMQISNAYNLVVKNSIFYNSKGDGIWMNSAYASTCPRVLDFNSYAPCNVDENQVNRIITIENNLMAENDISGLEFYGFGTPEYPNKIKGNLLVHNHKNAKYLNCPNEVKDNSGNVTRQGGHCPGGQMSFARSKNVVAEENIIRDGYINTVKPVDNYLPEPGASGKIYENLTPPLHASGIELADSLQDVLIQNNKLYNNSGVGLFADYVGVTRDYRVNNVRIIWNMAYGNGYGAFAGNPGPGLDIALTRTFGQNRTAMGGMYFDNNFLDSTHSDQLPYKKAFIFADPPICDPQGSSQCNTKIIWYTQDETNINVGLKDDAVTNLGTTAQGTVDVPWLSTNGGIFEIRSGNAVLASTFATRFNANPSPSSPVISQPSATLTANPNPCRLKPDGTCTTTITWTSQNAPSLEIKVGNSTVAQAPQGSTEIPWITANGATFEAYAGPNTPALATLTVKGSDSNSSGTISATNCTVPPGQTRCTSTITWSTNNTADTVQIVIKETNGLFASGITTGSQEFPWVSTTPLTMEVYEGTNPQTRKLLASTIAKASRLSEAPIFSLSASPNPCTLNANGTCTSTITWNAPGIANFDIYLKENKRVFDTRNSGSLDISFVTASGATFQARSNEQVIDSVVLKGKP